MDIDPFTIIDDLEQLVAKGTRFLGKCFISEEAFFVTTTRLKSTLPNIPVKLDTLFLIDSLEHLVETSPKPPLTAIAAVDSQEYRALLARLREALTSDQQKAAEYSVSSPANPDRTITDARTEAERIIQDAQAEAERIVAEARQQAAQPGSRPAMALPDSFPDTPDRL